MLASLHLAPCASTSFPLSLSLLLSLSVSLSLSLSISVSLYLYLSVSLLPNKREILQCIAYIVDRSEGFPARDVWFLGTLEQGPAKIPEFLGNLRRRRRRCPPATPRKELLYFRMGIEVQ